MSNMELSERDAAIRRVMKSLARLRAKGPFPVALDDGTSPTVIALPSDTMSAVHARVTRAGGYANVFVAYDQRITLVALRCEAAEMVAGDEPDLHPDIEIDMFLQLVRASSTEQEKFLMHRASASSQVRELDYAL